MKKSLLFCLWAAFLSVSGGLLISASAALYLSPSLPDVETLRDIRLQVPLRIYSSDNKLIAEFGEKRRTPVRFSHIPKELIHAFMAAEDDRFYDHHGVDPKGLTRAAIQLLQTGHIVSGGSTITMQVAKNFFLTNERAFSRKFNEILLALEIEQELTKDEILELYLNKIYLGNRAYGIGAAAQVYYGKSVDKLSLAQMAMIAGLPKAPSRFNPIANPDRALARRDWILSRMHDLGYISQKDYTSALNQPVTAEYHGLKTELSAPYVAEMVRKEMLDRFGPDAYTEGFKVYTTVDSKLQQDATSAVRAGLLTYGQRHGYRGPEAHLKGSYPKNKDEWEQTLKSTATIGGLVPAVVTSVSDKEATILLEDGLEGQIPWDDMKWARPYLSVNAMGAKPTQPSNILKAGDLIRIQHLKDNTYRLAQVPIAQAALIALRPKDGAIEAMVGGFDFNDSKFNRVTQASRQVGSLFKPFVYSAALEGGFTAATIINDAPVVFSDSQLESAWRPQNAGGQFLGPTRLRVALYRSRNLASIRLLQALGVSKALDYVERFGFSADQLPHDLSLALGSASLTPLEIARGFAIIANGGYKVSPYMIARIEQMGVPIYQADPAIAPDYPKDDEVTDDLHTSILTSPLAGLPPHEAEQVMDPRVNYIMQSILRDVVKHGTGRRALALKRDDIGGKTGTTNDQKDLWFTGFNHNLIATTWVGFDNPQPLGRWEYGSTTALPMWLDFMEKALKGTPPALPPEPSGLVTMRINPETGKPTNSGGVFELFRTELAPKPDSSPRTNEKTLSTEDIF